MPHPIPYQGSKRGIAEAILQYLPERVDRLVEPFAGSAAMSLAAAYHCDVGQFWLNDLNEPLMRLWEEIIERPDALAESYRSLWHKQIGQQREFYDSIRDRFNRTGDVDCFLYLLARCVKAAVRYNDKGEFNQSPDNRRLGARPDTMRKHIERASSLLRGRVVISAKRYQEVLDGVGPADIVYMDPPYQGVSEKRDKRYLQGVAREEFVEALRLLNKRDSMYIVSYDGVTGDRSFGERLPSDLGLEWVGIRAGVSSQSTLLGRKEHTIESLYLSPCLVSKIGLGRSKMAGNMSEQMRLAVDNGGIS